jgi:hypothetical protein
MGAGHAPFTEAIIMQSQSTSTSGAPLVVLPHVALYDPRYLGLPRPKNPVLAARLLIARARFPLPLIKIMGRNMVRVADIQALIQGLAPDQPPPATPPARKRGRRRSVAPASGHPAMLEGGRS